MINNSTEIIWLYALCNEQNEEIYVGISNDPERRVNEHNKGKNRYTKAFMPWSPFYYELYPDYKEARFREKYYKRSNNKKKLKVFLEKWRLTSEVTIVSYK